MAVSSKGQQIPGWGKRPQGSRSSSAPRLIKRLPSDAATTVFDDWFLDVAASSGVSLSLGTTTGPAVMVANVTVSSGSSKTLSFSTTTGPAVFACSVTLGAAPTIPDVVYLSVSAQDRSMGINYVRFPVVVPFQTRSMAVQVSRLPMQVQASPRLMRVA